MLQGDTFRLHWELLGLLCGIGDGFPVEEALSQGRSDEPKFVRVINVLGGVAFQMDGITQGSQSAFS